MAHATAYNLYGYREQGFWPQPPWWQYYPQVLSAQVLEAHLHYQQAYLQQQAASHPIHGVHTSDATASGHTTADPGAMQTAPPMTGNSNVAGTLAVLGDFQPLQLQENIREPVDFVNIRSKILSARNFVGDSQKPKSMTIRTASATEVDNKIEKSMKTHTVSIPLNSKDPAAPLPTSPTCPTAPEAKNPGAKILMMLKKDAASAYLMDQLNITPPKNESKALDCALGTALLKQLQTRNVNKDARDTKGAALLHMIQNCGSKSAHRKKTRTRVR